VARDDELASGELRRRVSLGTEAVYRVCAVSPTSVEVEVVSAPGLKPGRRFVFTRAAVLRMQRLDGGDPER
jgi:hypothetical protein